MCNTMSRRKDISSNPGETAIAAHQSGKDYKTISKQSGDHHSTLRKIIHRLKTLKAITNLPRSARLTKFSPWSYPRAASLQASISMLKGKVHD